MLQIFEKQTWAGAIFWKAKNVGRCENVDIFTGDWSGYGLYKKCSIPLIEESLDNFSNVSFEFSDGKTLYPIDSINFSIKLKDKLSMYLDPKCETQCRFILAPMQLLQECLSELSNPQFKATGGKCRKCGLFDEYAPLDSNGKCLCYKCFM